MLIFFEKNAYNTQVVFMTEYQIVSYWQLVHNVGSTTLLYPM